VRKMPLVVADTGDLEAVVNHRPEDCTTNPSIVLKTCTSPKFAATFAEAVSGGKGKANPIRAIATDLTISVGASLSALVPGRVSTEVDADLSFDMQASLACAHELVDQYAARGINKSRVLIKLAATWEGISAARQLEREGINCNLTLIFSFAQAAACADAGVFLISPFVGRITDWHARATGQRYTPQTDPGVLSVKRIYEHYKSNDFNTVVMGASFRNIGQIEALAGCDRLTISPGLLQELEDATGTLPRALSADGLPAGTHTVLNEATFRWNMNEDAMATEKMAEGIRNFNTDTLKLYKLISDAI
jgi:transaldolase